MEEQSKKVLAVFLMEQNGDRLDDRMTLTTQMTLSEKQRLQQSILSFSN